MNYTNRTRKKKSYPITPAPTNHYQIFSKCSPGFYSIIDMHINHLPGGFDNMINYNRQML
jgi:hypothetical protein